MEMLPVCDPDETVAGRFTEPGWLTWCQAQTGREANLDPETAAASGCCVNGGVVAVGDRPDDGKAEPGAISIGAWRTAQALEGLKQAVDLARWDHVAGVRDREDGAARRRARGECE